MNNVTILDHPLIQHKVSMLRDKDTTTKDFRELVTEIAMLMGYEAFRDLATEEIEVQAPLAKVKSKVVTEKITIVPILRAGLGMVDGLTQLFPKARIGHIGLYRDEETLEPVWYYDKTPIKYENPEKIKVFILDPMLATGNSALAAINLFLKKGIPVENLCFVSILSSFNVKVIT